MSPTSKTLLDSSAGPNKIARNSEGVDHDDSSSDSDSSNDTSSHSSSQHASGDEYQPDTDMVDAEPTRPGDNGSAVEGVQGSVRKNSPESTSSDEIIPSAQNVSSSEYGEQQDGLRSTARDLGIDSPRNKRKYCFKKRRRQTKSVSTMRKRWGESVTQLTDIQLKSQKCCSRRKCFRTVNIPYLRAKMATVLSLSNEDRRKWLADTVGSGGLYLFDGNAVCSSFLVKAFRFSRDLQSSVREVGGTAGQADSRENTLDGRDDERERTSDVLSEGKDAIITFLERLAEDTGEKMPDSGEHHLPFFKKDDVYDHFVKEYSILTDIAPPTKSYFSTTWKQYCAYVKVRKFSRFSKCTLCEELRAGIRHAVTTGQSTKQLKAKKIAHNEMIARERRYYKKKRDRSILQPTDYCSIIVDGADQSAFGIPHFTTITKDTRGHSMKVKLIGILEHSRKKRLHLLTLTEEHETGANHVVEALHRFICNRANGGKLPKVFYVQLDNCTRENKNRYFLSYMESLVAWDVFNEIEVGFLPVGHTHEDIDQCFSRTSERLRSHDAITLQDLQSQLRMTYNEHTTVSHMKHVANWSGLCTEQGCLSPVKSFSTIRYFKFCRREADGDSISTECFVRHSVDGEWATLASATSARQSSFITFAPDLQNMPSTKIVEPRGKQEITKRFMSEEGRINSTSKMKQLFALRDDVFRAREERFHWDLERSVEMQAASALVEKENEEVDEVQPIAMVAKETQLGLHSDYDYERNTFVAVRPDQKDAPNMTEDILFWIGKVSDTKKNTSMKVVSLKVQWFDLVKSTDIITGKYGASFLHDNEHNKQKPWMDTISSDSVLLSFDCLTKRGILPAAVQKYLRRECQE